MSVQSNEANKYFQFVQASVFIIASLRYQKKLYLMESSNRCILLFLLLAQLIAGVNQGRNILNLENSVNSSQALSIDDLKLSNIYRHLPGGNEVPKLKARRAIRPSSRKEEHSAVYENASLCAPWDSCKFRCSEKPRGLPYTCNCDNRCSFYSDCCLDYQTVCFASKTADSGKPRWKSDTKPKCELLLDSFPTFMISSCSKQYEGRALEELCSIRIPLQCTLTDHMHEYNESDRYHHCKDLVYVDCVKEFSSKCDTTVEPWCVTAIKKQCNRVSIKICLRCKSNFWPVVSLEGLLYRNSYCALCNSVNNYTVLNIDNISQMLQSVDHDIWNTGMSSKDIFRNCLPSLIDTCSEEYEHNNTFHALCANSSGFVIVNGGIEDENVFYKNLYCAICNGKSFEELACPPWLLNSTRASPLVRGIIPLVDFVTGDVQGLRLDDIPAAFSLLLNFGLDGQREIYISSEGEKKMKEDQKRCGKNYMWDPFSQICRKIHCSAEFRLVNYRCVKKDGLDTETDQRNETVLIPDAKAQFVHLTLSAEIEVWDFLQYKGFISEDIDSMTDSIHESLSSSFNISKERIRNVKFNISLGNFDSYKKM
ncbi:hypothetical protein X975_04500, partial [Stegodyphus mimosarum]